MGNPGKGWAIGSGIATLAVELMVDCLALALTPDVARAQAPQPCPKWRCFQGTNLFAVYPFLDDTPGAHSQWGSHLCLSPNPSSYNLYPKKWRHIILDLALCHTVLLKPKHGVQNSVYDYEARFIFGLPRNSDVTVLYLLITEALLLVICWFCKLIPGYWKH